MPNTPHGYPYPLPTDPVAEGAAAIQALAEAVDALDARVQIIRKPVDTARTVAATVADPHLVFNAEANTIYRVHAVLFYLVDGANSSVDGRSGLGIPAGATSSYGVEGPDTAIPAGVGITTSTWWAYLAHGPGLSAISHGVSNHATLGTKVIVEGIVTIGATAGPVSIGWGQNTASANALHLCVDSYLEFMKVA
jgi:hypothetical protein